MNLNLLCLHAKRIISALMIQYLFYFLAFVAIFSALKVVLTKNHIYSILFLILTFFTLTAIYILMLNAQFIGIVNIIVYAGAIMVLFLYTVMFSNWNRSTDTLKSKYMLWSGMIAAGILLVTLVAALRVMEFSRPMIITQLDLGMVKNLGKVLFRDFMLPFEVISILFLSAMVGAVLIAKKDTN